MNSPHEKFLRTPLCGVHLRAELSWRRNGFYSVKNTMTGTICSELSRIKHRSDWRMNPSNPESIFKHRSGTDHWTRSWSFWTWDHFFDGSKNGIFVSYVCSFCI